MFGISNDDISRLVKTNYFLILVESPVAFYFAYRFPSFTFSDCLIIVLSILADTLFFHLLILAKPSVLIRDIGLIIFALINLAGITMVMHFIPEIRPALLFIYIPAVIFSASLSTSFGILIMILITAIFIGLTLAEYFRISEFFTATIDAANKGELWQLSNVFSFFFILILGSMANYFFRIFRSRDIKIKHLAEINKRLYQQSKTTSNEIFKNMREALLVIDQDFKVIQYNRAFSHLVNTKMDLINQDLSKLPLDFSSLIEKYLEDVKTSQTKGFQFEAKDKVSRSYTINMSTIELKSKDVGFMILIHRRSLPWGKVFDSQSKKPIELALVRLHDAKTDKILESKVTDNEGRFGFILTEGEYYISVSKEDYIFPTRSRLEGYRGEKFKVKSTEEGAIELNIPMDKV